MTLIFLVFPALKPKEPEKAASPPSVPGNSPAPLTASTTPTTPASSGSAGGVSVTPAPPASASTDLTAFAQRAFGALARGDSAAEADLDWETLQTMTMNAGAAYNMLPNEIEKAGFRRSFIAQFSASFQRSGASADALSNWRLQGQDSARAVIAADSPTGATLLVTVSKRDDKPRISAFTTSP